MWPLGAYQKDFTSILEACPKFSHGFGKQAQAFHPFLLVKFWGVFLLLLTMPCAVV